MRRYLENFNRTAETQVRETGFEERIAGGWVFYFNSVEFLETGRFETQLVGQGPTIVLDDGTILQGGSSERPDAVLERFGRA